MSIATKTAIMAELSADTVLMSLLASDPNSPSNPAIFNARMNELQPVYDCITFREESGKPIKEFDGFFSNALSNTVVEELFDFEVWTKSASPKTIEAIRQRIDLVLYRQSFSLGASGRVFWSDRILTSPDNWDATLMARYGLFRYRLLVEYA